MPPRFLCSESAHSAECRKGPNGLAAGDGGSQTIALPNVSACRAERVSVGGAEMLVPSEKRVPARQSRTWYRARLGERGFGAGAPVGLVLARSGFVTRDRAAEGVVGFEFVTV